MGVFSRLAQLIKANLNDLISRSEDPEKMLNQVVVEMNAQLIQAKKHVAVSIADEKHLAKQLEQEKANAAEWERRAVLAVRSGDDNLAKEALSRKREHDALAKTFEEQWQKQKASVDQLKQALRLLNDKIEEAKRKKNVLIARKKRAEAQKAIHETMNGLKDQSAFETFSRLEQKIDRIEAEAEAGAELADDYSGDSLAHKFKKLEISSGADDELAALKEKMGLVAPAPPAPTQVRVEPVATTPEPARVAEDVPRPQHALDQSEQDELAAALAEIEAEEERERQRMKR
jgi:phage shock protein A